MSFTILTAISPDYADTLQRFIPTWACNSGAAGIDIRMLTGTTWHDNITQRTRHIRDAVTEAARHRRKVVWLDADIYVVRSLAGGFRDGFPLSIARWPNINAGVIYFNTEVAVDWARLLGDVYSEISDRPHGSSDQAIWHKHLCKGEQMVNKLDGEEWNYTGLWEDWRSDLLRIKDTVRALHTRGNGQWPDDMDRLARETFPAAFGLKE